MRTAVVLAEGGPDAGPGIPAAILEALEREGVAVLAVPDSPSLLHAAARRLKEHQASNAILLPGEAVGDEEVASLAGLAGMDPLNIEVVPAPYLDLARRAPQPGQVVAGLISAAAAAAQDARSLPAAHRDLRRLPGRRPVSRRALLHALLHSHSRLLPSVEPERCVAARGCTACLDACPAAALRRGGAGDGVGGGAAPRVDAAACVACGLCAAECPTSAMRFPPLDAQAVARRVRSSLAAARPGVLLFASPAAVQATLSGTDPATDPAPLEGPVVPVQVPCGGGIAAAVLLWAARQGAQVAVLPCPPGSPCARTCGGLAADHVQAAQQVLRALGGRPDAVRAFDWLRGGSAWAWLRSVAAAAAHASRTMEPTPEQRSAPATTAAAAAAGAHAPGTLGQEALHLLGGAPVRAGPAGAGPPLPLGVVAVRPDLCTACGLCAQACVVGALRMENVADSARLAFDGPACTACGACVPACPEGALRLERRLDAGVLAGSPLALVAPKRPACTQCGAGLPPAPLLAAVHARAGMASRGGAWARVLGLCEGCRLHLLGDSLAPTPQGERP